MKQSIGKIAIGILLLFYGYAFSQSPDPLIPGLKTFYTSTAHCDINKELFTIRAKNEAIPFNYVYVSRPMQVQNALDEPYLFMSDDTARAEETCRDYTEKGFSAFHYKTFGTADAYITSTLLSYSRESKAFIVFHEMTHNYIFENCIEMSYDMNEAACDVIAVMYSRKLLKEKHVLNATKLETEIKALETVYKVINSAVDKIEADSASCAKYCAEAEKQIYAAVRNCDAFFKDRFVYPVNTAYLLKNRNYSRRYFVVKEMYLASKNFKRFIQTLTLYN